MHFTTVAASAAIVGSAMASGAYYSSVEAVPTTSSAVYYTSYGPTSSKVYTSVATCTEGKPSSTPVYSVPSYGTTSAPVYSAPVSSAPVYSAPVSSAPVYSGPVTYTSYEHITVTSCADYVPNCPAKTYTSTAYSISTPVYSQPPYVYVPPSNSTGYAPPPPVTYTPVPPPSTYVAPPASTYAPPPPVTYVPPSTTYVSPPPSYNTTVPSYPPVATGSASSFGINFGVAAIAAVAALILA